MGIETAFTSINWLTIAALQNDFLSFANPLPIQSFGCYLRFTVCGLASHYYVEFTLIKKFDVLFILVKVKCK